MNTWGVAVWGDPCRECGFDWSIPLDAAASLVTEVPRRYADLLDGQDGTAQLPSLAWSAKAYVFHVVDNLWIYAERLWGAVVAKQVGIHPYDPDALAAVRGYERIPVQAALWALSHAARVWNEALEAATDLDLSFDHPERGPQTLRDIVQSVAHDAVHHEWDIRRSLDAMRPATPS